jgi:predicted phosphodiesterase
MSGESIRIISDLHYGDRATRVERLAQLRPLLAGVGHLVLNGDTLDTRPGPLPSHTANCQAEVLAFFPQSVPHVTFLSGNHDADFSPHHRLDLAAGQVFVIHGDIIFEEIVPWGRDAHGISRRIRADLAMLPANARDNLDERLGIWRRAAAATRQRHQSEKQGLRYTISYVADTIWPPWRVLRIIRAWHVERRHIAALTRRHRPAAGFVVTGHLHRTAVWRDPRGLVIINTGSFCRPFGGQMVDITRGRLTVRRIAIRRGEFHPGRTVAEFPLAET